MGLSAKDKKAVEKAAKAGGLTGVKVSSSGNVSASNSKSSSSSSNNTSNNTPAPVSNTNTTSSGTVKASTPTATKTSSTGVMTPLIMGTTAKDPASNVSKPSTTIPSSQSNPSNAQIANLMMGSFPSSSSSSSGSSNYTGGSIVDYLSSVGKSSDYNSRAALAGQYGIQNYSGTAAQNTELLNKLRGSGNTATSYSNPAPAAGVTNETPQYSQVPTTTAVPSPYVAAPVAPTKPNMGLYGQLIDDQAKRAKDKNEYDQAAKDYQKAVADRNELKQAMNDELANIDFDPGTLHFQQGRKQVLAQLYAQKLADADARVTQAQQAMSYATAQYGAETTALSNALGAAGISLSGGQYMPFGGESMGFQAGLDRQRMVDTYNYNTQQGLDFSGQASQLDQPMHALSLLGPQLSNYLASNGLNTNTSVMANSLINSGLSQTNPAAYAVIKNAGTEAQVLISQIAGFNSSLIPSDITQKANAMSIDNMSPNDIVLFINAANAIAQPRYASLKSSASNALGSSFVPYSGSSQANPYATIPATPTPATSIGNMQNTANPWANAAIGGALQFGSYIIPAVSNIGGWLFGGLKAAGAALLK